MEKKIVKAKKILKEVPAKKKVSVPEVKKEIKRAVVRKVVAAKVQPVVQVGFGLHNLKVPHGAHKGKRILGRGPSSGHGKTSTRGSKGQTSRSGRATYPGFEGGQTPIIRRIPKRGFTSVFKKVYQILNLDQLDKLGQAVITPELLEQKGLIKDKNKLIKILGDGEMKNAVTIRAHAFSKKAQDKLKASGSTVEVIRNA